MSKDEDAPDEVTFTVQLRVKGHPMNKPIYWRMESVNAIKGTREAIISP